MLDKHYQVWNWQHNPEKEISKVIETGILPKCPNSKDIVVMYLKNLCEQREKKNLSILDIGCAKLTFLKSVEKLFGKLTGIDIVDAGNWNESNSIETISYNIDNGKLPLSDNSYDIVTMLAVLEHVINPFHAIREIKRVCKKDGKIIIHVPNIAGIRHKIRIIMGKLPITASRESFNRDSWDGHHFHYFTKGSLEWLLKREGLKPIKWASTGKMQLLKRMRPQFFGTDLVVFAEPCVKEYLTAEKLE